MFQSEAGGIVSRSRGWELAALAVAGVLLSAATASAQAITIGKVTRDIPMRASTYFPTWINHSDCVKNGNITFSVNLPSPAWMNSMLEVWASVGTGCTDLASRTGSAPSCWNVYAAQPVIGVAYPVKVRMQDIVAQHLSTDAVHGPGSGTVADCDNASSAAPSSVTLQFMLVDAATGQIVPGAFCTYSDLAWDLLGPDAPTLTSVTSGGDALRVDFTGPMPLTDIIGYRFYCDLASSDAGCHVPGLQPGVAPDSSFLCGEVRGGINTSGQLDGLTAGTRYAVGVAGFDRVQNTGLLSNVACGTPRQATATQQSSGCSVAGRRADARWLLALGLIGGFGVLRRTRRRS